MVGVGELVEQRKLFHPVGPAQVLQVLRQRMGVTGNIENVVEVRGHGLGLRIQPGPRRVDEQGVQAVLCKGPGQFPQAPEFTLSIAGRYAIPTASGGEWFAYTDWNVRGPLNIFLYESVEFQTDTQFEGGLKLGYASAGGGYEVAVFARNITDEENVIGAIDFNNLTGFVNEPRIIGIALSARM